MLKNMYISRHMAWYSLLIAALFIILTACGSDSNTATATPAPTDASTITVGSTNTPSAPSPTPTPTRPKPTPTQARPTPTPTVSRPTPTPTPQKPTPTPTHVSTVIVKITTDGTGAFTFSPQALNVTAGTNVIWNNTTSAPHTVTGSSFGSGTISPGGSFSFRFTQVGTFAYHCMFHPYMTASIKVS
ncbi:MAG TPA: plastocyanin/azurin family copper-binding protein [Ktedonobacteraceae bacterium]|nr:plastocyanin/azurin family copper-binding protein [Ktedonobacteraceae bacterium]